MGVDLASSVTAVEMVFVELCERGEEEVFPANYGQSIPYTERRKLTETVEEHKV